MLEPDEETTLESAIEGFVEMHRETVAEMPDLPSRYEVEVTDTILLQNEKHLTLRLDGTAMQAAPTRMLLRPSVLLISNRANSWRPLILSKTSPNSKNWPKNTSAKPAPASLRMASISMRATPSPSPRTSASQPTGFFSVTCHTK